MLNTTEIVHRMRKDLYCCYRHFIEGRDKNQQTHCYGHIVKGIILPEPTVGKELKAKVERVKERKRQEQKEAKPESLAVKGKSIELKGFGYNINHNQNVKPSLPQHLTSPFIYCDKVYKKGTRPTTASQDTDIFLVTAENTCRKHLRNDIEIQEQLKKMTKEQRRQFFSRSFNLTESLYYFYSNIEICIEEERYKENFPDMTANPTLQQLFEQYCRTKKINLEKRHQYMMVDQKEFKDFIKCLGFPKRLYNLIDEFWELAFKEKIFENYQIPVSESKLMTKRTSRVISMKAFFYNFKKFYTDQKRYTFVFSPNMVRQRNVDLRYELFPWKESYRYLKHRLKELKSIEFVICEKLSVNNKQLSEEFLRVIEDRNQKCFKHRVLAKVYYPLVCKSQVNFDNLHQAFTERLERIRLEMELFEDFLEAFKDFRRQIAAREQNFDEQMVKATDMADFLAYSRMQPSQADIIIKWLNKFYKYMFFFKNEPEIDYDVNTGKTTLSKNIIFNYDEISEFLHYKCTKSQDQQNLINDFLLRLENFYELHTDDKQLGHSQQVFEKNIVAEFLLRQMRAELCSFEKVFSIVKIAMPYLEDNFNEETIKQISKVLAKNITSPGFNTKFLFSSHIIIANDNCSVCSVNQQSSVQSQVKVGNKWRSKIGGMMKIFNQQVESLEHVLLDWNIIKQQSAVLSYPNVKRVKTTQVRIEQPQELVPVQQRSSKTFNIKYVQIPKEKVYQVKVTKHQHIPPVNHQQSMHSAQSAIFQQQKRVKVSTTEEKVHLQQCQICRSMVSGVQISCNATSLCQCIICMKRHDCCRSNSDDHTSIQSVSDMQDQIMRLLSF